jgi:hypothetical protein
VADHRIGPEAADAGEDVRPVRVVPRRAELRHTGESLCWRGELEPPVQGCVERVEQLAVKALIEPLVAKQSERLGVRQMSHVVHDAQRLPGGAGSLHGSAVRRIDLVVTVFDHAIAQLGLCYQGETRQGRPGVHPHLVLIDVELPESGDLARGVGEEGP